MFLWSIALQYLIYTICILLIDHHIRYKYLFAGVILISCILIGWVYSILGIFTALIAIGMLMLTFFFFSTSRQQLVYALPFGLLTSLLGDHLTSIGDFFVLKSSVIEPGDSLQYFHIVLSAFLSALLAFCLNLVSHCGPPYDRYDRDIDIIYILYHYFLYPFFW